MVFDTKDLIVALSSAAFTLATIWFGSFLTLRNEKKKAKELETLQMRSIETEMTDIAATASEIQAMAREALERSIQKKNIDWLYAPPIETPGYSENFKVVHLNFAETKRRNIRNFYSIVSEINCRTARCRGYLLGLEPQNRVYLDYHALRVLCIQLLALNKHIDLPWNPGDEDFLSEQEHTKNQFLRVMEMQFGTDN